METSCRTSMKDFNNITLFCSFSFIIFRQQLAPAFLLSLIFVNLTFFFFLTISPAKKVHFRTPFLTVTQIPVWLFQFIKFIRERDGSFSRLLIKAGKWFVLPSALQLLIRMGFQPTNQPGLGPIAGRRII